MKVIAKYTKPGGREGFVGRNVFARYSKLSNKKAQDVLSRVSSYVLHREVKRPKTYNPIILYLPRELLQADLIDLANLHEANEGAKYILMVCDAFTRKCWARSLKNKTAKNVLNAFKKIVNESGLFKRLMTDAGTEFLAGEFKAYLKANKIKYTRGNPHAPHVERLNRTLQSKIFKYMTENETKKWVDVLQDVVGGYNDRYHRIIKMSPNEAEKKENLSEVTYNLGAYYAKAIDRRKKPKYVKGDIVSVQKIRNVFAKGYQQVFTDELFKVHEVHTKLPVPMYTLTEFDGETVIEGRFYENEMQKANFETYKIEKVVDKRTRAGVREILVKWKGWPKKYNQWIPESNVERSYS